MAAEDCASFTHPLWGGTTLSELRQERSVIRTEAILFLGVFLGSIWIHQPSRYYFFGDSWGVLSELLTTQKSILWAQNEHFIPLFKALYFLQYKLFGGHHLGFVLVLFALHAGVAVMVYRLGVHLSLQHRLSVVAALMFAFSSVHWEVTGWSFEQQFVLGTLLMLAAMDVFLANPRGTPTLLWVAVLSLAAYLAGGAIALSLPLVLTSHCLLRISYRREIEGRKLVENLLAFWLPATAYFICAKAAAVLKPGTLAPIPHLSLSHMPAFLDYTLFGTMYGVVLAGLTFLQAQTFNSATVILVLLAALVSFCYRNLSSNQRFSFWFLVVFLFTPLLVIGLGRLPLGPLSALSSRYSYIPTVPFALLLVLCWEALRSQQTQRGNEAWWRGLGVLLLGYYFVFHCAALRRHNPAADRGLRAQQFMTVAKRATYPGTAQGGAVVLGPELQVPEYVFAPGRYLLWEAFQVLEGNTHKVVPVADYLRNQDASFTANLTKDGDFETLESAAPWKTYGAARFERSQAAARTGSFGAKVTLGTAGAFAQDAIKTCPAPLPPTIFTFSIQGKSNRTGALVARIISKDSHGTILEAGQSLPHAGDNQWHQLVVSALSPPGTCVVGVDVTNSSPAEIEAALDDAILVAHPGTLSSDGKVSFRSREEIPTGSL